MRGKAQLVARPAQTRLHNLGPTGPKLTKFLSDVEESSTMLLARIHVAILQSAVECKRTEWRWGIPISADLRQNWLPCDMSLEQSRK